MKRTGRRFRPSRPWCSSRRRSRCSTPTSSSPRSTTRWDSPRRCRHTRVWTGPARIASRPGSDSSTAGAGSRTRRSGRCGRAPPSTRCSLPSTSASWSIPCRLDGVPAGRAGWAVDSMITDTVPAATTPLAIARALAPRIRERATEIEAARQLPAELVLEIANARLFKVALSEAEGGLGADVLTSLRVIEEVARADGSTGWCVAMGINTFRQSAQLAPAVRRELFFGDAVGVSAGSARERGRAVAVPGGYRVTGRWFFASGCMHSALLHGACRVFDGDAPRLRANGDQEIRIAYFHPKSQARIIDTWNVSGLRGTGSHDIEVEDLFVPEEHTFSAMDRRARVTGPMNRIHGFDLAGCGFCCVGLGVARAAIDEFVALSQVKVPRGSSDLLRDRAVVQSQIGEAEAMLRSGRALLFDVVGEMWQTAVAARPITERQRADLRLAMTHAAQSAATATHMICATAGTTSIFTSSPLERYARDAEVVTRHNQLQFVNYEAVGRTVLGLESNSPLF